METVPWNIVTGCERITPGCDNCPTYWAYLKEGKDYHPQFNVDVLREPLLNDVPTNYLVAMGSDMFHEAIKLEEITQIFEVMTLATCHTFEVGTKRIERMQVMSERHLTWKENMIAVTAVEDAKYRWRIDCLREINARRMVMFGPMVGRVGEIDMAGIEVAGVVVEDWGKARVIDPEWADELTEQCQEQGVRITNSVWLCEV